MDAARGRDAARNGRGGRWSARSTSPCCSAGAGPGGRHVGDELAEAFRIAGRELGAESRPRPRDPPRRASACTARSTASPSTTSTRVDAVAGAAARDRPAAGRSSCRSCRATSRADPERTVFDYRGIISPPRDSGRWEALVEALVRHLVERVRPRRGRPLAVRGLERAQPAGVLDGHASRTYFALYDASARAVKRVDPAFRVGGPSTAAAGWVDDLLEHGARDRRPGRLPQHPHVRHAAARPAADRRPLRARRPAAAVDRVGHLADATARRSTTAPGARRSSRAACGPRRAGSTRSRTGWSRTTSSSSASREALFHGGFGLLTVGNLRKPRFWGVALLERLGATEVPATLEGDGGGSLVEAWAAARRRRPDRGRALERHARPDEVGRRPAARPRRDAAARRAGGRALDGAPPPGRRGPLERPASVGGAAAAATGRTTTGWAALRDADRLETAGGRPRTVVRDDGGHLLGFAMPMPSLSLVELPRPAERRSTRPGAATRRASQLPRRPRNRIGPARVTGA